MSVDMEAGRGGECLCTSTNSPSSSASLLGRVSSCSSFGWTGLIAFLRFLAARRLEALGGWMASLRMTGSERQSRKVEKLDSSSAGIMLPDLVLNFAEE